MTAYTQAVQAMVAAAGAIVSEAAYGDMYDRAEAAMRQYVQSEIDLANKKEADNG
jgi:predicted GNAT superfamily acetyltransferase